MHVQGMLTIILLHALFHPELTQSSLICEDEKICGCLKKDKKMQIKSVPENTTAVIPCANLEENEELLSASLYKGKMELHSADMTNKTHESWQQFKVSKENGSISYRIQSIESNDTGIYICKVQTLIGQTKTTKENNTILLVQDAQQSTDPTEPSEPCPSTLKPILYWVCGVILLCNLIITVTACFLFYVYRVKIKKTTENPYMNTIRARYRCR